MPLTRVINLVILLFLANCASGQIKKVQEVVDSCVKQRNFNGAVLIARSGKIEYLKYTGIADRVNDIRYSENTRFHIWSLTKTFTAVLIMQLYEQKKNKFRFNNLCILS